MRASVSASLPRAVSQSSISQPMRFEGAATVRDDAGGVGQGGIELAQDPQAGPELAAAGQLLAHRVLEPCRAQPSGASEVAAVAGHDHLHRSDPGAGLERLLGGGNRGRPDTLEQVTDLLDAGDVLVQELLATHPEVPQPAPGLIDRFGQIAAQLGSEPGDQHGVLVVGLVGGQVLTLAGPRGQHRLDTDERHAPVGGQLAQHPPSVPGRFAGHRHPGPALRGGTVGRPVQRGTQIPGLAPKRAPRQDLGVVIGHHHHLLAVGQIDPHDRVRHWDRLAELREPGIPVTVTA